MTSAGFHNPVQVITGDFVELIGDIASPNEPSHKLLVASDRFSKTDDCSRLMMRLGDECSIFTAIENDPSVESCQSAIDLAIHSRPDLIIAIGGGSVIDTAKAMRLALYKDESEIRDLLTDMAPGSSARKPDFLAVPTTHGTGSEVTMWATIWDKIEKRKYSISDPASRYCLTPSYSRIRVDPPRRHSNVANDSTHDFAHASHGLSYNDFRSTITDNDNRLIVRVLTVAGFNLEDRYTE